MELTILSLSVVFYILSQGVEMMHYDSKLIKTGPRLKKLCWLEPELLRICIDYKRSSVEDLGKLKIPPGLYLRDISEVRAGVTAYDFQQTKVPPQDPDCCFSIIGSEATICVELPTPSIRDWFLERVTLLAKDILIPRERQALTRRLELLRKAQVLNQDELLQATQLLNLLRRGVQVLLHTVSGSIVKGNIVYENAKQELQLKPFSFFAFGHDETIKLSDIVEIRPGTHSYGFVMSNSTDKDSSCLSIVGSERTLNLQLATMNARDLFVDKLNLLIRYSKVPAAQRNRLPSLGQDKTDQTISSGASLSAEAATLGTSDARSQSSEGGNLQHHGSTASAAGEQSTFSGF
jgi:hypothetical protein